MCIKSTLKSALVGALVLVGTVAAQAATVPSTGASVSGGLDANYFVVGSLGNIDNNSNGSYLGGAMPGYTALETPYQASVYSNGVYASGLTFLSATATGADNFSMNTIVYQVTFNLAAETLISGMWAADNGAAVYNNGLYAFGLFTQGNEPASNYTTAHPFSFLGQMGQNTLTFFVTDGGGPSAFALSVSAVPGPILGAGLPGLLMAIGGFVAMRRRRLAAP